MTRMLCSFNRSCSVVRRLAPSSPPNTSGTACRATPIRVSRSAHRSTSAVVKARTILADSVTVSRFLSALIRCRRSCWSVAYGASTANTTACWSSGAHWVSSLCTLGVL
eukprot:Amastigsp_a510316_99.p3 type:complete len:109 gc:universal Amastigsp_a510316_99:1077-751(-)